MLKEMLFNQRAHILLGKMLDKASLSQRVIASNIAHVKTPGYETLGVKFDEVLRKAVMYNRMNIKQTNPRHLPDPDWARNTRPEIATVENGYWNGINNVNIDQEMVELAKNQLDFNMAARLLNLRFTALRTAIRGRR